MTESSAIKACPDETQGADIVGRHKSLGRRTALISSLTLISRMLGYVREVLSAALFGDASPVYDAFITAWRIPNLFRRFFGEGALSTSLQSAITEVDGDRGEDAGRELFLATLKILVVVLVATSAVVMGLVMLLPDTFPFTDFAWLGADPEPVRDLTVRLMPFVVLVCLSAAVGGALNVRGHFAAPAWAPAIFNVVWIASLVLVGVSYGWTGVATDERHVDMCHTLAWGVLGAGAVQLFVQVPALIRTRLVVFGKPVRVGTRKERRGGALSVLKKSAPLALGAAVYQVNVMIDGLMAEGLLADGGPTLHYYANRLQQFPMALIAVAATSAVFPALKALGHRGAYAELRGLYDKTQLAISFVALPASLGLFVLAEPIVSASFEHGAFGEAGVARTSAALRALSLAILPAGAVGLVARTYYSLGDFKTPVRVSAGALVLNVLLNALLIVGFDLDVDGLAWATAITSWGNLAVLLAGLRRRGVLPDGSVRYLPRLASQLIASLGCAAAAFGTHRLLAGNTGPIVTLLVAIAAGVLALAVGAQILRIPEWNSAKAKAIGNRKGL